MSDKRWWIVLMDGPKVIAQGWAFGPDPETAGEAFRTSCLVAVFAYGVRRGPSKRSLRRARPHARSEP